MKHRGFTVIEIFSVILIAIVVAVVVYTQLTNLQITNRNNIRKSTINSLYYNLEDIYFPKHRSYPQQITSETLPGIDNTILTDPNGHRLGTSESNYRYEPVNCVDGKCKDYKLRAILEKEADFVKQNRQ